MARLVEGLLLATVGGMIGMLFASWFPARRAAASNPPHVMRAE
jgi:ABC-type lipoprotein release transport system permease subunit